MSIISVGKKIGDLDIRLGITNREQERKRTNRRISALMFHLITIQFIMSLDWYDRKKLKFQTHVIDHF